MMNSHPRCSVGGSGGGGEGQGKMYRRWRWGPLGVVSLAQRKVKTSSTKGRDLVSPEPGLGQEQRSRTDSRLARGPPQAAGAPPARPRLSSGKLCRIATSAKSPYRRPYRMHIQCRDHLTPYPDTRASVGKVEVIAVTSPLYWSF
jgi:hypothetical protein